MQSFPGTFNINLICYISIRHQEHLKKFNSLDHKSLLQKMKILMHWQYILTLASAGANSCFRNGKKKKKGIRAMPKVFVPWIRDSICKTQFYVSGICSNASSTRHQQEELKLSYLGCHHSYHISEAIQKEFLHETGTITAFCHL